MGREQVDIARVVAIVSRHNSEEDREDDALAEELKQRLSLIVAEPKYKKINAMNLWDG